MKILAVDDERDVQNLFEQRFRKEIKNGEVEFVFANSGNEAMSYLTNHNREEVLVLSDINMPGMSGLELLQEIKQKFENPSPVVMMVTDYGDEDNYNQAIKFGADDFLTKPVDFKLLKEKLKTNRYLANAMGFSFAATSNYFLNRTWTFESSNPQIYQEYGLFIIFSLIGLGFNTLALRFFEQRKFNFYVSKFFAIVLTTFWNFGTNYFFNFTNR